MERHGEGGALPGRLATARDTEIPRYNTSGAGESKGFYENRKLR